MMRNIFLGFIRIHILHHASEGEIFGIEMMDELRSHGYLISSGTLYPILHSLEEDGYLTRRDEVVSGKVRKYYRITERVSMLSKTRRRRFRNSQRRYCEGG